MNAPRAFVAGATGYTGERVVAELTRRGVRTVAHVRPDSARRAEWARRFGAMGAEVAAVPWEADAIDGAVAAAAPTHVFALLGTTRWRARREGTANPYETVDYGLTRRLLDAVLATRRPDGAAKFVYLSAVGVGPRAPGAYIAVRWRFEEELRASGLPYVIARPSFITGPDREESRPTERITAAVSDTLLAGAAAVGLRALRDRWGSMSATTLAHALVQLALDPKATAVTAEGTSLRVAAGLGAKS